MYAFNCVLLHIFCMLDMDNRFRRLTFTDATPEKVTLLNDLF
jgi:hypothetical protein